MYFFVIFVFTRGEKTPLFLVIDLKTSNSKVSVPCTPQSANYSHSPSSVPLPTAHADSSTLLRSPPCLCCSPPVHFWYEISPPSLAPLPHPACIRRGFLFAFAACFAYPRHSPSYCESLFQSEPSNMNCPPQIHFLMVFR